jgi:hypothetical protein
MTTVPKRHAQDGGFSLPAMTILTQAMFSPFPFPVGLVLVVHQVVGVVIAQQDHVTPLATITPVGATPGFVFFATKGHATAPTITRLNFDDTFVDKHDLR